MTKIAQSKLLKKADEFHDPEQKIPSHGTSLAQVPALHKKVKWVPGTRNLDYGGGRYDHATEFLREKGVENFVFDPYNRDAQHNAEVKAGADARQDLRKVYEAAFAKLQPKYGHWVIFNHCMPFDVTRAHDEASGIRDPRIWTAERDQQMWHALQQA